MLVHWIWFAHRPGLNDRDKMALLQHFRDPEDIYFADDGAFDAIGLSEEAKTALREKNLTSAEEILEACDREKLHILTCQDAAYPARLKNIVDPPTVLYYKGRLPDFDGSPVIGVVGTRKASAYGLTTAKRMGYQIARCGGIVVSGMAYGIDGMAMSGALTAGTPAVGVLGCGAVPGHGGIRLHPQRVRAGDAAGQMDVSQAKPHHQRPELRCAGGGSAREKRRADHRPFGRRAGAGRVCGAGKHRPAVLCGEQPASAGRGDHGFLRLGRSERIRSPLSG